MKPTGMHIIFGQIGTGPVANHPVAGLEPDEQALLGWLVEAKGGGPAELDECLAELEPHSPRPPVEEIAQSFGELTSGGYLQRVSEAPLTYRVTPAGFDAAVGYGALAPNTGEDQDSVAPQGSWTVV